MHDHKRHSLPKPHVKKYFSSTFISLFILGILTLGTFITLDQVKKQQKARTNAQLASQPWVFEELFTGSTAITIPSQDLLPRNFDYSVTHATTPSNPDGNDANGSFGDFMADHDGTTCTGPAFGHMIGSTSHRSNGTKPDNSFFICKDHMMSSMGDVGTPFSSSSFWPKQEFVFPSGGILEYDVNINGPHRKAYYEVSIVPITELNLNSADIGITDAEPYPSRRLVFRFTDDIRREIEASNTTPSGAPLTVFKENTTWSERNPGDPAIKDAKIRRKNRIEINENEIRWSIAKADGTFDTVNINLPYLPLHRGFIVFKTLAQKPGSAGNPNGATFHWDNIRFSGEKIAPYTTIENSTVINLESASGKAIGSTATQSITINTELRAPFLMGEIHGALKRQVLLSINGGKEIAIEPLTTATSETGCSYPQWRTFRIPLSLDDLKIGVNTLQWKVGPRPACAAATDLNGFSVKGIEIQHLQHSDWWNGDCNLSKTAFCDSFDFRQPEGRGGDLDERVWNFSRVTKRTSPIHGNIGTYLPTEAVSCGKTATGLLPPSESFICPEKKEAMHWATAANDGADDIGYMLNSARIRQAFDFANRTGKIVFNLDGRTEGLGTYWTEMWLTKEPVSAPHTSDSELPSIPQDGLGIEFAHNCTVENTQGFGVSRIHVLKNFALTTPQITPENLNCVKADFGKMNHIEILVSEQKIEVWASDASTDGNKTFPNLRRITILDNLALPFSRGYVSFQHDQINGEKFNAPFPQHTYHWDNIGFDGPLLPINRGYDVPDSLTPVDPQQTDVNVGYVLVDDLLTNPSSMGTNAPGVYTCCTNDQFVKVNGFTLKNVNLTDISEARLLLNPWIIHTNVPRPTIKYQFNGGVWRDIPYPVPTNLDTWNAYSVPVSLSDLQQGENVLRFRSTGFTENAFPLALANISLELIPNISVVNTPTLTPTPTQSALLATAVPTQILTATLTPLPTQSVPTAIPTAQPDSASLSFKPATGSFPPGTTIPVEIRVNSEITPINAVEAHILFNPDHLELISIGTAQSSFSLQVEQITTLGNITLTRGTTTPISGDNLVAVINFKTKGTTQTQTTLSYDLASKVAANGINILHTRNSAVYTITVTKPEDLNGDGTINIFDFSLFLTDFGSNNARSDFNHDSTVNIFDFSIFLLNWGKR